MSAWFAAASAASSEAVTPRAPTRPVKASGRPAAGRGRTSISIGADSAGTPTVPPNSPPPKEKPNGSLNERNCTCASSASGSMVRGPAPVG